jgi:hypothetical protein
MENRDTGFEGIGGTTGFGTSTSGAGTGQGQEMKEKATQLSHTARRKATERLDSQKGQISSLLDKVADTMEGDQLGGYAAEYVRKGAELLRGRSTDELLSTAGTQLRTHPAALVGAAFLAGFAIARMARR